MDDFGIDRQVLTLVHPTIWRDIDRKTALAATRVANDAVTDIAAEHPDRFVPGRKRKDEIGRRNEGVISES